jgi:hypothetical protein
MSLKADRREWDDLAREDGMWAVHSDPQRRGSWTAEEFFATGDQEIGAPVAAAAPDRRTGTEGAPSMTYVARRPAAA